MDQAALTVEELLALPVLQRAQVISGANGLQNEIRYVDVMEIPDLTGWLRPHELVLTTGYAFLDNPYALSTLLDEMHKVGGAAIGVKQQRFGYRVSEEAQQKSDEYAIPILDIPAELTTIDITHSIMEKILNRQFVVLSKARDVNSEFMKLILHRRSAEIVTMLGNLLHCEVAVLDTHRTVLNATPGFREEQVAVLRPIRSGNLVSGYLALSAEPAPDDLFAQMCLEQALTVLALEFTIQEAALYRREHAREEFLLELLTGVTRPEEALHVRAQRLHFPRGAALFVLVVQPRYAPDTPEEYREDLQAQIRLALTDSLGGRSNGQRHLITMLGENFVVLAAASQADVQERAKRLAEQMDAYLKQELPGIRFVLGIGCPVDQLSLLARSYTQALHAVEAGQKVLPERQIIHYRDVYIEDMLLSIGQHPALVQLYTTLLQPLYHYDMRNGTELCKTLEAVIRHGGNTRKVAEELFVHRNSVNYRLERVREILDVDILEPETRTRLDLLFRAWKLQLLPP
ncbi:sugar diacid utilization regulator [Thermosporothrix hazakensis]|jgi:purine catabolism regulator|uniref:Sugar diacid utilization regulator n=1 Tax=Thermosporothrix hazakensis TaxID=644383 RepID=A0A326TX87_THEHA|nr:PucR family transcriptional regulator [Thermosporothrix hazakensis]PZW21053.1 sugar diacid utilization regulator [Thermosporothrix hazakensis]GCE46375.1 transcriptional regulator [Thermosporothrix hazakensis]